MASFHLFDEGRPTDDFLAARFGTRPPAPYVRFAQWCHDRAAGDQRAAELLYWRLLGLEANDVDSTGYTSPFELYSAGDYDGDQVGWVVLAPERPADDYPWVWYQHDGNGHFPVARDTPEFLARTLSYALATEADSEAEVTAAAAHLGVAVSRELGESLGPFGSSRYYERGEPCPTLHVEVPDGWRYEPSPADEGVGVLAPADAFASGPHVQDRRVDPLDAAAEHGNNGHPATALWHLLTPNARHGTAMEQYGYWIRFTKQAYVNLGRPHLAARVDQFCE